MNFEPDRVLRTVIEFYSSSGIIEPDKESVTIVGEPVPMQIGDRQKYEQINLFIFGHLLPTYAPLTVELKVLTDRPILRTHFELPKASNSAYHTLFEELFLDTRLDKLNQSCGAKIRTSLAPPKLILDFPIQSNKNEVTRNPIDLKELRQRFESLSIAKKIVNGYLNNGNRHLSLLERAIEEADGEEAIRNIQALKGGALNICALDMTNVIKRLELAIKHESFEIIPEILAAVRREFGKIDQFYDDNKELFNA